MRRVDFALWRGGFCKEPKPPGRRNGTETDPETVYPRVQGPSVQRLLESCKPLLGAATELGVSPGQLSQCRNEQLATGSAEALAAWKTEQAETQRLKRLE